MTHDDLWAGPDGEDYNFATSSPELDREWRARREQYYNAGYREGLDEGNKQTLQEGFDTGFKAGAAAGHKWGGVQGALKTLQQLQADSDRLCESHPTLHRVSRQLAAVSDRQATLLLTQQLLPFIPGTGTSYRTDDAGGSVLSEVSREDRPGSADTEARSRADGRDLSGLPEKLAANLQLQDGSSEASSGYTGGTRLRLQPSQLLQAADLNSLIQEAVLALDQAGYSIQSKNSQSAAGH